MVKCLAKNHVFFFIKYSDVHKIKANKIKGYHGIMHMKMYIYNLRTNFCVLLISFIHIPVTMIFSYII